MLSISFSHVRHASRAISPQQKDRIMNILQEWQRPDSYIGPDYYEWCVLLGQNRDSDTVTRSNFAVALQQLQQFDDQEEESYQVIRDGHWACGWIEYILIHASNSEAVKTGERIKQKIDSYPILDEYHHGELEDEEALAIWKNCFDRFGRADYIRSHSESCFDSGIDNWSRLRECLEGKFYPGHPSELIY